MDKSEKFVVIGSNCFSGACFIDYVLGQNPNAEVLGISRSAESLSVFLPYKRFQDDRYTFHQLDLNHHLPEITQVIKTFKPDYIVNFSAQGMVAESWKDPAQWFRTNCVSLVQLVDRLRSETFLKRFVQISSPEVYGSCVDRIHENAPLNPTTPYAASKAGGDLGLIPYFKTFNFPVTFTRATNVYGAHQQLYRIIPRSILYIKMGKKIPLQGGGKAIKSYIHIRDVCDATLRIARKGTNGETYHISPDGSGVSIYNLIQNICQKLEKNFDDSVQIIEDRKGQDAAYTIDSSKIRNELNWRPVISLEAGLTEVVEWVNDNFDQLSNTPLEYIHKP